MTLRDFNDNWLHKDLPVFFRVKLQGAGHPLEFQQGDLLSISNHVPFEGDSYVALKVKGMCQIVSYKEFSHGPNRHDNVIGIVQ